jgi:hypothetical protein
MCSFDNGHGISHGITHEENLAADPTATQVALRMSFATVWEHIPIKSMGPSPSARGSGNIEHIERAGLMLMLFTEF